MIDSARHRKETDASGFGQPDREVRDRVHGEYREMPGLRLTVAQAARLFNLEPARCSQVLDSLVADGALWTNGREFFGVNVGRRCA